MVGHQEGGHDAPGGENEHGDSGYPHPAGASGDRSRPAAGERSGNWMPVRSPFFSARRRAFGRLCIVRGGAAGAAERVVLIQMFSALAAEGHFTHLAQ